MISTLVFYAYKRLCLGHLSIFLGHRHDVNDLHIFIRATYHVGLIFVWLSLLIRLNLLLNHYYRSDILTYNLIINFNVLSIIKSCFIRRCRPKRPLNRTFFELTVYCKLVTLLKSLAADEINLSRFKLLTLRWDDHDFTRLDKDFSRLRLLLSVGLVLLVSTLKNFKGIHVRAGRSEVCSSFMWLFAGFFRLFLLRKTINIAGVRSAWRVFRHHEDGWARRTLLKSRMWNWMIRRVLNRWKNFRCTNYRRFSWWIDLELTNSRRISIFLIFIWLKFKFRRFFTLIKSLLAVYNWFMRTKGRASRLRQGLLGWLCRNNLSCNWLFLCSAYCCTIFIHSLIFGLSWHWKFIVKTDLHRRCRSIVTRNLRKLLDHGLCRAAFWVITYWFQKITYILLFRLRYWLVWDDWVNISTCLFSICNIFGFIIIDISLWKFLVLKVFNLVFLQVLFYLILLLDFLCISNSLLLTFCLLVLFLSVNLAC